MLRLTNPNSSIQIIFVSPEAPITFLGIDDTNHLVFRISVGVNPLQAIKSKVTSIEVSAFASSENAIDTGPTLPRDPAKIIHKLTSNFNEIVAARRLFEETKITKTSIDITASTNNDLGMVAFTGDGDITALSMTSTQNLRKGNLRKRKYYLKLATPEDRMGSKSEPVQAIFPCAYISNATTPAAGYKRASEDLISVHQKDPASLLDFDFPISYIGNSMGGTIAVCNKNAYRMLGPELQQKMRSPSSLASNHIRTSIDSVATVDIPFEPITTFRNFLTSFTITDDAPPEITVRQAFKPKYQIMSTILKIPIVQRSAVPIVYIGLKCKNIGGKVIQRASYKMNLGTYLEKKEVPALAPTIHVINHSIGMNILRVSQQDPYGQGVFIYRKVLENVPEKDYAFTDQSTPVAMVTIKKGDGAQQVIDNVPNGKRIIYRAVAVGKNGTSGPNFASAISLPSASVKRFNSTLANRVDRAYFSATLSTNAIGISANAVIHGGIVCFLEARDITGLSKPNILSIAPRIVGNDIHTQLQMISTPTEVGFTDEKVELNHTYHYSLVTMKPDGRKVTAAGSLIKTFIKRMQGLVINITNQSTGGGGVTFDLSISTTQTGLETIVAQLKAIGADQSYIDQITASKEQFSPLFRFLVDRTNLDTGEIERMGVFEPGTFIDNPSKGEERGTTTLRDGHTYKYEITALRRDPFTLLYGTQVEEQSEATLRRFTRDVRKFLNPLTLKNATLPSTQAMAKIIDNPNFSIDNEFLDGNTGVVKYVVVEMPATAATISSVIAKPTPDGSNLIGWTLEGNPFSVDHFVVFSKIAGVKAPIGTVIAGGGSNYFTLVDDKTSGIVGTKIYTVLPIFADFSAGIESSSASVTRSSSISSLETKE